MAQLHIRRDHSLSLAAARKIAYAWAEEVKAEFGMECTYKEGAKGDMVTFTRSGVNGTPTALLNGKKMNQAGFFAGGFQGPHRS